jgi:hypothetical protein
MRRTSHIRMAVAMGIGNKGIEVANYSPEEMSGTNSP